MLISLAKPSAHISEWPLQNCCRHQKTENDSNLWAFIQQSQTSLQRLRNRNRNMHRSASHAKSLWSLVKIYRSIVTPRFSMLMEIKINAVNFQAMQSTVMYSSLRTTSSHGCYPCCKCMYAVQRDIKDCPFYSLTSGALVHCRLVNNNCRLSTGAVSSSIFTRLDTGISHCVARRKYSSDSSVAETNKIVYIIYFVQ